MRIILVLVLCCWSVTAHAQEPQAVPDWEGTWEGTLVNLPLRPNAPPVDVKMELGAFPVADDTCSVWRTTYSEKGEVRQVKDYQLCRGTGPDDLFVDEGDGIILKARLLGDVLVSPFKYNDILLVTTTRLRGDVLEEEIITAGDEPAIEGVQTMVPRGIQRLTLRRADTSSNQ